MKTRPFGSSTRAPRARQREARGMSAETTMSPSATCSAIRSSAASRFPRPTTTSSRSSPSGIAIGELATKSTRRPYRAATRATSAFTGQASASTWILITGLPWRRCRRSSWPSSALLPRHDDEPIANGRPRRLRARWPPRSRAARSVRPAGPGSTFRPGTARSARIGPPGVRRRWRGPSRRGRP